MRVLAVDMGATSVRVASIALDPLVPEPHIVHRWRHRPVRSGDGSLRWDWRGIVREIRKGIDSALAEDAPVASIGVAGWGVDYALVDTQGVPLSAPFSYRDNRTNAWQETANRIGTQRLYEITGVQLMPINTIFQLAAHDPREIGEANRLLLLPDLLVHELTGHVGIERSNASTTGLLDARTDLWSNELLDAIGVPASLMPDLHDAPERVGTYRGVPVHLVGSHDTASAIAALPGNPGPRSAFVSSGTWILVGAERTEPDLSDEARLANFTNERGALGGIRFLKNVTGFWMVEMCRPAWGNPPIEDLVREAAAFTGTVPVFDTRDERFLAPEDMQSEVRRAAGLGKEAGRAMITRCILESIAHTSARVVEELGGLSGQVIDELLVVGGGVRMDLMNRLYEEHTGLPVRIGSPEATALGNAIVQGLALGAFDTLQEARSSLAGTG